MKEIEIKDDYKGFLFLNFPALEEDFKIYENMGINFDKIIFITNEDYSEDV